MRAHIYKHHREASEDLDHLEDVLEYGTETGELVSANPSVQEGLDYLEAQWTLLTRN